MVNRTRSSVLALALAVCLPMGCGSRTETAPPGWLPDELTRQRARAAIGARVSEAVLHVLAREEGAEEAYYRITDPSLLDAILTFLSKASQRDFGHGVGYPATCDGYLHFPDPKLETMFLYKDGDLMGPGWSKLWNRMLKEGKRIPPPEEDE